MPGWNRGAAVTVTALAWLVSTSPVSAITPTADPSGSCIDYGQVGRAPAGRIPRDDLAVVRKDPQSRWITDHPEEAQQAVAAADAGKAVTVPVAFHVVYKTKSSTRGDLSGRQIRDQIAVLNGAYASSGFQFKLVSTTRTPSASWFSNLVTIGGSTQRLERGGERELAMKRTLHVGGAETLNVYTASLGKFVMGWAYYPTQFTGDDGEPLPRYLDGVVIDYRTLPGSTARGFARSYDEGDTATHEIGHWLNLYHTFQNGCEGDGDAVDDTPFEAQPAYDCLERDSCTGHEGVDPIHNFMDYTPDGCMNEFTEGQSERMQVAWTAYRS